MDNTIAALPLRALPRASGLNLVNFPSVLDRICRQLCLHCQVEHVVIAGPDILPGGFENQTALARFSRCSRRLRDIAQPVLFHWYHASGAGSNSQELNRLVTFLHAILQNPTLARSTRALALCQTKIANLRWAKLDDSDGFFRRAVEARGGYRLQRRLPGTAHVAHGRAPRAGHGEYAGPVAALSAPRSPFHFIEYWPAWDYEMPNLKYLAFAGNQTDSRLEDTYDLKEARNLLRCAPNLATLIAPDCWGGESDIHRLRAWSEEQPWDVVLAKLRKISLNNVDLAQLGPILQITTPDHLFRKLPPALRRLRIGYVAYWPTVYRDLLALTEEPSRRFPRLQAVTLEVFEAPPEPQQRHLAERLGSSLGVTLLVCHVAGSKYMSRGLLPERPGRRRVAHEPVL